MDCTRAFEVVTGRIKEIEPNEQLVMRIVGFVLLQCGGEEMIRLAHVPDQAIENVVQTVKHEISRLGNNLPITASLNSKPAVEVDVPPQFNSFSPRGFSSPIAIEKPAPKWDARVFNEHQLNGPTLSPLQYHDALLELQTKARSMSLVDRFEHGGMGNLYPDEAFGDVSRRISGRSSNWPDFPTKQCHYFRRGSCRYGNSCPYSHEQNSPGSLSPVFDPCMNHFVNDEHMFITGSLERLEMEITELLRMRGGGPIPIATLPGVYSDTYGRALQADGYLTESQRNGKAGYGLTKLLARFKNSICIIDRPHGQHSIILAEDVPKYFEFRSGRNSPGPIVSGSRQIYLTFTSESSFTEDDVTEYFSEFGKVEDVRMPCQQERMFGFVTFSSPETVKTILSMPNPHFVGGFRVLVKPYREKPKLPNRRFMDDPIHYSQSQPYSDMDSESLSTPSLLEAAGSFKRQQIEEYMRVRNRQRLMDIKFGRNAELPLDSQTELITTDNASNYLGPINTRSESVQENGLPDSPFSSPVSRSIST